MISEMQRLNERVALIFFLFGTSFFFLCGRRSSYVTRL